MPINVKKMTFIGGGSAYIPLIVGEIAKSNNFPELNELIFVAPTIVKQNIISQFCSQLFLQRGKFIKITTVNKFDKVISNSDVIIGIYRVGGLEQRHFDETFSLDLNVLGQESQGIGGFSSALRNIVVLKQIAPIIQKYAPNALYINITNPSGILTAAANQLGIKSVGICDVPYAMRLKTAQHFGVQIDDVYLKYIGLNHLSWITEIHIKGEPVLDSLLNSSDLNMFMNTIKQTNIPKVKINLDFFRAIHAIPSSYLFYYYNTNEILENFKKDSLTRAQRVMEDNKRLYKKYKESPLDEWPQFFQKERGAYLLGETVVRFLNDYVSEKDSKRDHIICIPNGQTVSFLDSDKIIETQVFARNGIIKPVYTEMDANKHIRSLMMSVSEYERLTVCAGLTGNKGIALEALASHPLIPTVNVAAKLLDRVLDNKFE